MKILSKFVHQGLGALYSTGNILPKLRPGLKFVEPESTVLDCKSQMSYSRAYRIHIDHEKHSIIGYNRQCIGFNSGYLEEILTT